MRSICLHRGRPVTDTPQVFVPGTRVQVRGGEQIAIVCDVNETTRLADVRWGYMDGGEAITTEPFEDLTVVDFDPENLRYVLR